MSHQSNFVFNCVQMSCCCLFIILGTKWFRYASTRWVFGTVAELSHPRVIHQFSLWWFAATVSLLVLNGLAFSVPEDNDVGADARQKIALVIAIAYTLWSIENNAFPLMSQTLWDFEDGKLQSKITNPVPIKTWPINIGWGSIGSCGTTAVRNFLYFADVAEYDGAIIVIGVVECVFLFSLLAGFSWQFLIPTLIPEICGSRTDYYDVTKSHYLKAPRLH